MKEFLKAVDSFPNRNSGEFRLIFSIVLQSIRDLKLKSQKRSAKKFLEKDIEFYTQLLKGEK